MRNLKKLPEPEILSKNREKWLSAFLEDMDNPAKRYKYRHKDIKETLKKETGWKCVYCESKIGHNTPGDVEHKIPTSKVPKRHFDWDNLTVACTECNRRKNNYYSDGNSFLDPYVDDVENLVEHYGPIMGWKNGNEKAEITIKILELDNSNRKELIFRKIEKIEELNNIIERYKKEGSKDIKALMKAKICRMIDRSAEYSGMLLAIIKTKGLTIGCT